MMWLKQCILSTFLTLCAGMSAAGEHLRYGVMDGFSAMDPIYTTTYEDTDMMSCLFDTLLTSDRFGNILPGAAESWTVSDDGLTYRFRLRDGATWSDGTPLTAQDFVVGFQRIVDPSLNRFPKPTYLLEPILNAIDIVNGKRPPDTLGISAPNDRTVEIRLVTPASYFPSILIYPGLTAVPVHVLNKYGEDWYLHQPLVSNGAYELVSQLNGIYELRKRADHWEDVEATQVTIRVYDGPDKMVHDFLNNNLDITFEADVRSATWMRDQAGLAVHRVAKPATTYGVFNTRLAKFADPEIRVALANLIERHQIARATGNDVAETFTSGEILNGSPHIKTKEKSSRNDRVRAASDVLQKAGYSAEKPLEIEIMLSDRNDFSNIANGIIASWSLPEIRVTVDSINGQDHSPRLRTKQYEFSIATWFADFPDPLTFLALLQSTGSKNHSAWVNAEYDALVEQSYEIADRNLRQPIYEKMEHLIAGEAPVVPLVHPLTQVVASDRIIGFGGPRSLVEARNVVFRK